MACNFVSVCFQLIKNSYRSCAFTSGYKRVGAKFTIVSKIIIIFTLLIIYSSLNFCVQCQADFINHSCDIPLRSLDLVLFDKHQNCIQIQTKTLIFNYKFVIITFIETRNQKCNIIRKMFYLTKLVSTFGIKSCKVSINNIRLSTLQNLHIQKVRHENFVVLTLGDLQIFVNMQLYCLLLLKRQIYINRKM